jgi:hypothetical protein
VSRHASRGNPLALLLRAVPSALFSGWVVLAISLSEPIRGAEPPPTESSAVDLASLTLLPQTPTPVGLRALRQGEADAAVVGRRTPDGTLILTMEMGRLFTRGVKVYSEPSHTLVLAGMTREQASTAAGLELKRRSLSFTGTFPDTIHRFELPVIVPSDDVLLVYCIRETGDYLVAAGRVTAGEFAFRGICRDCR